MKKLLLTAATAATLAGAAQAYTTGGVTVNNGDCEVHSNPNQDRHYWIPKLALREFSVADSIKYHEERSNGNNFNAAAVCWMEDRGNALVYMDNGGDNDEHWDDLGFDYVSSYQFSITTMSYEEKIDFLNSTNNYIVSLPTTQENVNGNTLAMQYILAQVDGVSSQNVRDAWIGLMQQEWTHTYEGFSEDGNSFLEQWKEGWENAAGTYVAAVPAKDAVMGTRMVDNPLPSEVSDRDTQHDLTTYNSLNHAYISFPHSAITNDVYFTIIVDGTTVGYLYRLNGTVVEHPAQISQEYEVSPAVAATPAMYGDYPLTDWTDSLNLTNINSDYNFYGN